MLVSPAAIRRHDGGYGTSGDDVVELGVIYKIPDGEIRIITWCNRHDPDPKVTQMHTFKALCMDLVSMKIFGSTALTSNDDPIRLPLNLSLVSDDRIIEVDGKSIDFRGASIDNGSWVGQAVLSDDRAISIVSTSQVFELRTVNDW